MPPFFVFADVAIAAVAVVVGGGVVVVVAADVVAAVAALAYLVFYLVLFVGDAERAQT